MRGGVIKRGDGPRPYSYVVRELDPATGRKKPRWVSGFATQREAKAALAEAQTAQNQGTYVAPRNITVGEWLDTWIEGHVLQLKPSTAASYRGNIRRYLKPTIGHERLQGLAPARLSAVFRTMYEEGGRGAQNGKGGKPVSPRTVEFARSVLRRAMRDAVLERLIAVNPVTGTKRPKVEKPQHTTWTGEQLRTYLDATAARPLAALYALAAATGMRRGELLALQWVDVDVDAKVVRVDRSLTQIGSERKYTTPKNHERRTVSIDERTVATLKALHIEQAKARLQLGEAWLGGEGMVFGLAGRLAAAAGLRVEGLRKVADRPRRAAAEAPRTPAHARHPASARRRAGAHRGEEARPQGPIGDAQRVRRRHPRRRRQGCRRLHEGGVRGVSDEDRTERVQRALGIFAQMMRHPRPESDDESALAAALDHVETLGRELGSLGLNRDELDEVVMTHFQGVEAARPFESEQFAKMAYLVKHAPGKMLDEAIASLTPEQFDEYTNLTADYLDELISGVAADDVAAQFAVEAGALTAPEAEAYRTARDELLGKMEDAQGTVDVTYVQFQQALDAGADCSTLFELRNRMDPKDPLREKANLDLRSVGCYTRSSRRGPDAPR